MLEEKLSNLYEKIGKNANNTHQMMMEKINLLEMMKKSNFIYLHIIKATFMPFWGECTMTDKQVLKPLDLRSPSYSS